MLNQIPPLADWFMEHFYWWTDSNWWLVIIGGITALFICWQSLETRKAAQASRENVRATKDSADAALLNAKALIVSERPWLLVTIAVDSEDPDMFVVTAVNKGNTPARLHEGHCSVEIQPFDFSPPDELRDPFYLPLQSLTVSGDRFEIRRFKPDFVQPKKRVTEAQMPMLFVYGRLLYWDSFVDRDAPEAKPYVTQWSWSYNPAKREFFQTANGFTIYT